MAALDDQAMNLTGGSEPERVQAARVGAMFWSLLGVTPEIGRGFAPNEDSQSAGRTVVLSDGLWKRRFGADRRIVGKTISLDGNSYTVIGVAPHAVQLPRSPRRLGSARLLRGRRQSGGPRLALDGRSSAASRLT